MDDLRNENVDRVCMQCERPGADGGLDRMQNGELLCVECAAEYYEYQALMKLWTWHYPEGHVTE